MRIFDGYEALIYGKGESGLAAQTAIHNRGGKTVLLCDPYTLPPAKHYDFAVISPGVRPDHPIYGYCAERGIRVIGEAELGFRLGKSKDIIAVTGTNGKTTVTRLLAAMLNACACGNIGFPICSAIDTDNNVLVCELSSFQLCKANISPKIAVITNIAADHLDYHGGIDEYVAAKLRIASGMKSGCLVLGDGIKVGDIAGLRTDAEIIYCSMTSPVKGAYLSDGYFCFFGERVCRLDYLKLRGNHNIQNALCAIAAAKAYGANNSAILDALVNVQSSPHRMSVVSEFGGKIWIDDSKSTNIASAKAAIAATSGSVCLIAGGRNKSLDMHDLFIDLDARVTTVIAMGESAEEIKAAAPQDCKVRVVVCDGLESAVRIAAECAEKTVLLSPCAASFDEFKNYAERGDKFALYIKRLKK